MANLLLWDRCDAHLPHIRVSRNGFVAGDRVDDHAHEFAEWFWVESGTIAHRCDGVDEVLTSGAARFLPPGHAHGFVFPNVSVLVTVSIPMAAFAPLRRRYADSAGWPWPRHGVGRRSLDALQLATLGAAVAELPAHGQELADREWFLATLVRTLRRAPELERDAATPAWLGAAVRRMREPDRLAAGLPELVRLSARSAAHVSRAVRRHYGCTATALVNRHRLEHAACELRLGRRPITAIAFACGYGNLGHFYRQFRAAFGQTPRAFRHAALGG